MAASTRSLPDEIPRIPTGKPGSIANRIFSKVSRKSKSRKTSHSSSTGSSDYYERRRSFSNRSRKDLKGRILEIFEENENEYAKKDSSSTRESRNDSHMENTNSNFSNLEREDEIEEDKRKLAKRSLELKNKMKDYLNKEGKFKSMDVRTPVLDEKYTGKSLGKRRPSEGSKSSYDHADKYKDISGDWAVNKYQAFHRSPSPNTKLSRPSEAWSPSPTSSPLYKERSILNSKGSKTYTKTLNKVLSNNLRAGNLKEEDGSERRRLSLFIWGCIICASCVILAACILGVVFAFLTVDSGGRYQVM